MEFESFKYFKNAYLSYFFNYTFKQSNISEFETKTPDYLLINFAVGGKVTLGKTAFNVSLNANNLLDKTYVNHLSRLKTDGINNMGKNVILTLNFDL